MQDDTLSSSFQVKTSKAAAAFSDPMRRRVVLYLTRHERSASELAVAVGVELKRLHYHLGELEKLGLIVVVSRRARAGRPIKLYRAIADAFFVSAELAFTSPSDALDAELRAARAQFSGSSHDGTLYRSGPRGEVLMRPVKAEDGQNNPYVDRWRIVPLSPTEAQRLATEFDACVQAAVARSKAAAKTYLVHFAFAPRQEFVPGVRKSKSPTGGISGP